MNTLQNIHIMHSYYAMYIFISKNNTTKLELTIKCNHNKVEAKFFPAFIYPNDITHKKTI